MVKLNKPKLIEYAGYLKGRLVNYIIENKDDLRAFTLYTTLTKIIKRSSEITYRGITEQIEEVQTTLEKDYTEVGFLYPEEWVGVSKRNLTIDKLLEDEV